MERSSSHTVLHEHLLTQLLNNAMLVGCTRIGQRVKELSQTFRFLSHISFSITLSMPLLKYQHGESDSNRTFAILTN